MGKYLFVCGALLLAATLMAISGHDRAPALSMPRNPQKIVSLAPAITETLFALGLGKRLAGVTEFCAWPPETAKIAKVGGFREVNPEAIARAQADLAILPADMAHFKKAIEDLGVPVLLFDYSSLRGFLDSIKRLGQIAGAKEQTEKLAAGFEEAMRSEKPQNRPSVLFVLLNQDEYDRPITEMTIIGADEFYNELIDAAGGKNAYTGATPFPRLSLEAVIGMNPDVIAVGAPELAETARLEQRWRDIGHFKGIQGGRLLILNDPADTIPGPRSLETLKKLEKAISLAGGKS